MKKISDVTGSFFAALTAPLLRFPKTFILLMCVLCGLSVNYTVRNLGINTDTTKILSQDLPFLQDRARFLKAFPQDDASILVVVDAVIPEKTSQALAYLASKFNENKKYIESVYIPGEGEFFDRHALLYLDLDDLNELAEKMAEAQPFIGTLMRDNSLKSLLSIVGRAVSEEGRELPVDLKPLLDKIREVSEAFLDGKNRQLSWQRLTLGDQQDLLATQRFILLKPVLDFNALVPAEKALEDVRGLVEKAKKALPGVRIRLTGEVVLEHDELVNVQESTNMATIASIILVCLALLAGYRSWKLMLITIASMLMGLSLALGFATWAVGHLNLISIAFAVLYIGVGDDYAIQLNLRYRELLQQTVPQKEALIQAVRYVGPSIALCAITTSLGFFSFIPTDYVGVAELGVIAGGGIVIALFISITVIPALLRLFPLNPGEKPSRGSFPAWVYDFPMRHALFIKWTALGLTLVAIGLLTQVRFDFNPLNLRNPDSESVATFRELLKTKTSSPMTLTVLTDDGEEAKSVAQRLEKLKTVEEAVTIFDFIPKQQEPKLEVVQELALVMGLRFSEFPPPMPDSLANHRAALAKFIDTVDRHLKKNPGSELSEPLLALQKVLRRLLIFIESKPLDDQEAMFNRLQRNLLGSLPFTMNKLWRGFEADRVTLEQLPKELSERWLSKDGTYRIQVFPGKDLNDRGNLKEFVEDVRKIVPRATDLPVIYLESADSVVRSFRQALVFTLAAIVVVLLIVTRSVKDTSLILLPLLMTAILTGAATVVLDTPFNFANIIVIPLLLGLGVDSGIYIVSRLRAMPDQQQNVLRTSTARGVVFSCLTTVGSLVSMAFTSHPGLASMGLLLAVGLTLVIVCTIVVLPAYAYKVRG
jgi:hopanoid biosynthesis associated RND transporter like protein HpnN